MGERIDVGDRVTGSIGMNRITGIVVGYVGKDGEPGRTAIIRDEYGTLGPYTVLASTLLRASTSTQGDRK